MSGIDRERREIERIAPGFYASYEQIDGAHTGPIVVILVIVIAAVAVAVAVFVVVVVVVVVVIVVVGAAGQHQSNQSLSQLPAKGLG